VRSSSLPRQTARRGSSFSIEAGQRHTIQSVSFVGNTLFTDTQLKQRVRTRAKSFFGFLNHGFYSNEVAKADANIIQTMYRLAGYEAAFVEPKTEENTADHEIAVRFEIIENMQFNIERLSFLGNDSILMTTCAPGSRLRQAIPTPRTKPTKLKRN
jgi:outer membrane protein assembly factor BamA